MFSDKCTLQFALAKSRTKRPRWCTKGDEEWRFLATTRIILYRSIPNSLFKFCNGCRNKYFLQDNEFQVKDDRKANPHAKTEQWCIQPGSKVFFCSSCLLQIVISRSVKLWSFFHSIQQLNYVSPLNLNKLYGSILLFDMSSLSFFKFVS